MNDMELVKAVSRLNKQTLIWLEFFLEAYGALGSRKTYLRLFLKLENSQRDFLREKVLLQGLLSNEKNISVVEAVANVISASYPQFAEAEVTKMKEYSPSASSFPSIDLYIGAVKTLHEAVLAVKEVLIESLESFIARSSTVAFKLYEGCKTSAEHSFTKIELAESLDSDRMVESHAVMVITSYFNPHIKRLEELLIRAEKIKERRRAFTD